MNKHIHAGIKHLFSEENWNQLKSKLGEDIVAAYEIKKNIQQAIDDLDSGKVFEDDEAAENMKNTLLDLAKIVGQTALFVLPGGSIGIVAIRRFLLTEKAKKMKIHNLLSLSIKKEEEQNNNKS